MIYYACDICDTPNLANVNEVIISIKIKGEWFGDKTTKQVCSNCLRVSGYEGYTSIAMGGMFFKTVWRKLWRKP